jgi:DNA-binding GntR family transcriptional regulator
MDPYQTIKDEIITCRLRPGDMVNESETAHRYGLGRAVVREAFQALVRDGFVEVIPRAGYIVSPLAVRDVMDLYGVRAIVEAAAVGLAAANASPSEIERLQALAQTEAPPLDQIDLRTLNRRNTEFHCAIAEATHNRVLAAIQSWTMERLERLFNLDRPTAAVEVMGRMARQHQVLVDAIAAGDSEKGHQITLQEIELSRRRVMEAIVESGNLPVVYSETFDPATATTTPRDAGGLRLP